ncbi:uncharacterized protein LOC102807407 [Saccoglossus kowalevskii]
MHPRVFLINQKLYILCHGKLLNHVSYPAQSVAFRVGCLGIKLASSFVIASFLTSICKKKSNFETHSVEEDDETTDMRFQIISILVCVGLICMQDTDACSDDADCLNGGTCTNTSVCDCVAGFVGDDCGTVVKCSDDTACQNGGTCTSNECVCVTGYAGDNCETATCGSDADCQNGGTCTDSLCIVSMTMIARMVVRVLIMHVCVLLDMQETTVKQQHVAVTLIV